MLSCRSECVSEICIHEWLVPFSQLKKGIRLLRNQAEFYLLCRLYAMGVITTKKSLVQLEKLSTASFCRRRLSVVLVRLKMSENLKEACRLIEQVSPPFPHGASGPQKAVIATEHKQGSKMSNLRLFWEHLVRILLSCSCFTMIDRRSSFA